MMSMLPIGATLQMGKYRVDRHLASGGFGNTYVITNVQFDEQFALKEFFIKGIAERDEDNTTVSVSNQTNVSQFEGQREKFKKEARRLRKLHNPHIVGVHDLFEENGTAYYVMDFIDGESLSARLKRTGKPLLEAEAMAILRQVLDALEEVHGMGIWHLDLKPGNILIDRQGNAKLIDFGASKQLSSASGNTTTTTAMCYTPGYAPTEQIDQNMDRIGAWTDLYALGATLYNLLTANQPPALSDIQDGDAFLYPQGVSDKTRHLIEWMMTPQRSLRPQSVAEVRNYLSLPSDSIATDDDDTTRYVERKPKVAKAPDPVGMEEMEGKPYKKWALVSIAFIALAIGAFFLFSNVSNGSGSNDVSVVDTLGVAEDTLAVTTAEETAAKETQKAAEEAMKEKERREKQEKAKEEKKKEEKKDEKPKTATNLTYSSAIGTLTYTGPIDEQGRPHGNGRATFSGGSYNGNFSHGVMSGSGVLRNSNGTFNGSFSNNYFVKGRFTASNGSVFVGSFSSGKPSQGTWYDANGNVIQ